MKYLVVILIGVLVGYFVCAVTRQDFGDKSKKRMTDYLYATWPVCVVGAEQIINREIEKDVNYWNEIAANVRAAEITKTSDTDNYVLTLRDIEGRKASLWLNSDGKLRSITAY